MLFDLSLQSTRFVQTTVQLTKFTAIQLYYSKLLLLLSISVPVNLPFPILIHVCMLFNLSLPSTCFVQTTVQLTKFTAIQLFASGNNVVWSSVSPRRWTSSDRAVVQELSPSRSNRRRASTAISRLRVPSTRRLPAVTDPRHRPTFRRDAALLYRRSPVSYRLCGAYILLFFYRMTRMHSTYCVVAGCLPSARPSAVRPSDADIVSIRPNTASNLFHRRLATPF